LTKRKNRLRRVARGGWVVNKTKGRPWPRNYFGCGFVGFKNDGPKKTGGGVLATLHKESHKLTNGGKVSWGVNVCSVVGCKKQNVDSTNIGVVKQWVTRTIKSRFWKRKKTGGGVSHQIKGPFKKKKIG